MKTKIIACVVVLMLCAGCNRQEAKRVSRETSAMSIKFNALVAAGKTTREQEKAYIDAVAKVMFELDRSIRGTKEAQRTQRNAEIEAKTGINLEGPLELNMNDENEKKLIDIHMLVERAACDAHKRALEAEGKVARE